MFSKNTVSKKNIRSIGCKNIVHYQFIKGIKTLIGIFK